MTKYNLSLFDNSIIVGNDSSPLIVQDTSTLANFLSKASDPKFNELDTGIMPPGVLNVNNFSVIYERPPQFQNIQVIPQTVDNINYKNSDIHIYRLPIPWQLYICTYSVYNGRYYPNSVSMFFMNSSLTNSDILNHRVYLPTLPNFYTSALLCNPMFASMEDIERYDNNISGVIQASYDWIWNSGTNLDLTMTMVEAFYQLPSLTQSGIPTVFDKIGPKYFECVGLDTYYLQFSYIDMFFKHWETYQLHEISNLTWPTVSSSSRLVIESREIGDSLVPEYFAHLGISSDTPIDPVYSSSCDDEECEECYSEDYLYDRQDYLRYVRAKLRNVITFQDAYNQILLSLDSNTSAHHKKLNNIIIDLYMKSSVLT